MKKILGVLTVGLLFSFGAWAQTADPLLRITKQGQVQGYADESNGVYVWKGVPYAESPVGDLRFKEPKDAVKYDGILDATKPGNMSIQLSGNDIIGSEDCLNLDIYRPATESSNLPVVVYIHGGNNQTGHSGEISGLTLAREADCVYVSLNYRLGALGFNCLPALKTGNKAEDSGNYALLDIAKALDWIKENAETFGADGNNITVTGFSAGGRDVMAMLISPIFKGKFQKAISYSGGMTVADVADSQKVFAKAIAPLVVEDGIKNTENEAYTWLLSTGADVKDYLYNVDAARLARLMGNAGIRMSVFPHLFADGYVIPKKGFDNPKYNNVPLIMLTGTTEFSFFNMGGAVYGPFLANGSLFSDPVHMAEFNWGTNYGSKLYELFNAEESAQKMKKYKGKIYTCTVNAGAQGEFAKTLGMFGAFHGIFVPMIDWENKNYEGMIGNVFETEGGKEMSTTYVAYIKNFIRTGDPNGKNLPEWTVWTKDVKKNNTLWIDADSAKADIRMTNRRIVYEDVLKEIDSDNAIDSEIKQGIITTSLNGRWFSSKLDSYYGNKNLWTVGF